MAKEEAGFWDKLQHVESYDPERTLLVDDNHEVLECAEDYGIKHLLAIHRPDSRGGEMSHDKFHHLKSFEEMSF
jgi:putative hydrolase of the HAD superfamily